MPTYVSCVYAIVDPMLDPEPPEPGKRKVECTDENGRVWILTEDSIVGDWLEFRDKGGTVREAGE